jgi:hypothetical protein
MPRWLPSTALCRAGLQAGLQAAADLQSAYSVTLKPRLSLVLRPTMIFNPPSMNRVNPAPKVFLPAV